GDGLAELRTGLRVVHARLEAGLDDADAAGGDRDPALVQGLHRVLEALALLADEGVGGYADVVERQFGGGLAAEAELAVDQVALETRCVGGNEERRDAACAFPAGAGEDEGDVGDGRVGDE